MHEVTQVMEWSEITLNSDLPEDRFQIPEGLQELAQSLAHSDSIPVVATELANGVYFGESVGMNNMWVEFEDFILVAEGPNNEAQSLEVIRQIRETVGDKPIRYLVTTHHHADHTGGIRTYAAEGATIVTQANNEAIIISFGDNRHPYGDLAKDRTFSDYRDVGNIKLPFSEITQEMHEVTQVMEWSEITLNSDLPEDRFQIPEGLQELAQSLAHSDSIPVVATELANGVYFGESVGMNNMWVEFEDFILVAEGPNNEVQSLEVIRQIRETVGDKPIRYLVTTHHHADHTGGIRTYAAEGATIVTQANNESLRRLSQRSNLFRLSRCREYQASLLRNHPGDA